jgi:hypothetical protein
MRLGRRTWGFLAIAAAMVLLYEPTPEKFRWVNLALAGLSFFWFVLFLLEDFGRARRDQRRFGGGSR